MPSAIQTYLDGEADPMVARKVRDHLGSCWHCGEDAEWLLLIKVALRDIGPRRPTDLAAARLERFARVLAGDHRHGRAKRG